MSIIHSRFTSILIPFADLKSLDLSAHALLLGDFD
jgi:hypothetical protein